MASAANVHREMVDAFNQRDWDKFRGLLHPEYSYTGGDGKEEAGGPDVGLGVAQMYASAFSDARLEVKKVYVQGDTGVAEMAYRGTHTGDLMGIAPTGKRISGIICNIIDLRDGKIYREREYFDMMHMMTQLGVVSAPAGAPAG